MRLAGAICIVCFAAAAAADTAWKGPAGHPMKTAPVWDLAKDAGARSAQLVRDGYLPLDAAHAFDIPNDALRDTTVFTAEISFTCDDVTPLHQLKLLRQRTPTTGWALDVILAPTIGSPIRLEANDAQFDVAWWRPQPGATNTFVVTARRGMVVVYENGRVLRRFFLQIIPNLEPIRVGPTAPDDGKGKIREMKGVKLRSLRFWDGSEEYWTPGETKEFAEGFRGGRGWLVSCPREDPAVRLPRILCMGDSILGAYTEPIRKQLAGKAYVYAWRNFEGNAKSRVNMKRYQAAASVMPFDAIVFNNGLHSLRWTEDQVTDAEIRKIQQDICRGLKSGSPKAKMFWLSTTPHTSKERNAKGVVDSLGELNGVVQRINRLTAEIAQEEGAQVIDGYGLLAQHLEWAHGDGYHWRPAGNEALAAEIVRVILPAIEAVSLP